MQTTIVVENLTVRFYPWDEELGQFPTNVSKFKVYMRSSKKFCFKSTTSADLYSVHAIFEVPHIFPRL